MAQFDVYANPSSISGDTFPYLLDVQNNLHANLKSRMVIPLAVNVDPIKNMTPVFEIKGQEVIMYTMEMTSVPSGVLVQKVTNLEQFSSEILNALDFLINGF